MRRFSLQWGLILACAVLLLALGIGLGGTRAAPASQAGTGQAAAPNAPNALLYDQLDSPGSSSDHVNSQDYEAGLNGADDQAADDFPVPAGVTWGITQVVFLGEASSAANQPTSFNVYFYSTTGTLPGAAVYTATAQTFTRNNATNTYTVTLTTPATLNGGSTYWVSVQGVLTYGANARQWFWRNRTVQSNNPAAWRNPGGSIVGVGCTTWSVRATCWTQTSPDQVFRLNGTSVVLTATPTVVPTNTSTAVPPTVTSTGVPPTVTQTAVPPTVTSTGVPPTVTQTAVPPTVTQTAVPPTVTQTATAAASATATDTPCPDNVVINGSLDANDATAPDRVSRSGTPSACGVTSPCPPESFAGPVVYDAYTFQNPSGSPQCVTIRVDAPTCDVQSVAYNTTYDPTALCTNYMGDSGGSTEGGVAITYSITVPAGGQFVVEVNPVTSGAFCGAYTLTVGGCGIVTPTPTSTATATQTETALPTATQTQTAIPTATETATETQTAIPTATETETAVATATETETAVATVTETVVATATETAVGTATETAVATVTETGTAVATETSTAVATGTSTAVASATTTAGPSSTTVPSHTATAVPLATRTVAPTATQTPVNCPLPFTDVDQFNPFYQYIQCLYCRGIISGYSDNTFRWGNDVTRGQVTKFVANAAGFNDVIPPGRQTFTDVPPANPFYTFIERLYAHGDINGYDTAANCPTGIPCFRWELPVTRGQLAKIDSNAAGYNETPGPTTQSFRDVPAANPFYLWIERLSLHGVINGYTCGGPGEPCPGFYYRPFANITRGQTSKVVAQSFFSSTCTPLPPPAVR